MRYAAPDPDELFCLDWEDYGSNTMSLAMVKDWISEVESQLGREGQCVLYSGNTAKEALGNNVDTFLGDRRLWLCQYGTSPVCQKSWDAYWMWQFTDGVYGPSPHSINGVGPCDINSYDGDVQTFLKEWATGDARQPIPPVPAPANTVGILIAAPPGITIKVHQFVLGGQGMTKSTANKRKEGGAE
jgi:lysozyme